MISRSIESPIGLPIAHELGDRLFHDIAKVHPAHQMVYDEMTVAKLLWFVMK